MKIEFEYFENQLPLNTKTMKMLAKKGTRFFCHVRKTTKQYNHKTWKYEDVTEEFVCILDIHKNIILFNHDFFGETRYKEYALLGVCPLEFPNPENISIKI